MEFYDDVIDDITDTDQKPRTAEQRKKIREWWERRLIAVSQTTLGPRRGPVID